MSAANPSRTIAPRDEPFAVARVDVERFEQVVWSLLSYVVAHADPDSPVRVEVARRDEMAIVGVESRGMLVDQALLPHLFDSFHLESRARVGDGWSNLGTLSRQTHRGGTRRQGRCTLVRRDGNEARGYIAPRMIGQGEKVDGGVLIVDDDELIRETMCELIEMAGCSAMVAANGREALKVMTERRPCLVILDLLMPVMTGNELLEVMRREPALADIPVVVSTSAPDRAPPGVPIIRKPVSIDAVMQWMQRTCRCASPLPGVRADDAK